MSCTYLLALNRGEIAIRIMRAATELGLRTVAVYAKEDGSASTGSRPTRPTDRGRARARGGLPRRGGHRRAGAEKGVDAIHPGYGFLSENPALARACERAGITFVGPTPTCWSCSATRPQARRLAVEGGHTGRARHENR
jgi:acetyl/propionyl-CoA carboxylase alpha subunit